MPKYIVEQYETHVQRYEVEAEDKAEAIKAVINGHADPKGETAYLETDEDAGQSPDGLNLSDEELAKVDKANLYDRDGGYVMSIRSVSLKQ